MLAGNQRAKLAFDIQVKRIVDYIGSYYVLLDGIDAISFTAGIGENSREIREAIVSKLRVLGVTLDPEKNKVRGTVQEISTTDSKVKAFIIPTDEELMLVRETMRFI